MDANIAVGSGVVTIVVGIVSLLGGMKLTRDRRVTDSNDYVKRTECEIARKQIVKDIESIKSLIKQEHKENREDRKILFDKIDTLTEYVLQVKNNNNL